MGFHFTPLVHLGVLIISFVFIIAILPFSLAFTIHIGNLVKKDYQELRKVKRKCNPTQDEENNAKENYTRDRLILAVVLSEVLYKVIGIVDIIYLASKRNFNPGVELINSNCLLKNTTSLALYCAWGPPYIAIVSADYVSNILVLSLICALSMQIKNAYYKRGSNSLYHYLAYTVLKLGCIPILYSFAPLFLLAQVYYIAIYLADYVLLVYLTRKLYQLLKRNCIDVKNHGSEEELRQLGNLEKRVKYFQYFSVILIIGYAIEIFGQFAQILIESIIGSVLINPCWFEVIYGIKYTIDIPLGPYEMAGVLANYLQFAGDILFNTGLLLIYILYCWKQIVESYKQVRVYRYHVVAKSLKTSLLADHN